MKQKYFHYYALYRSRALRQSFGVSQRPTTSYIVSTTAQPFSFSIYANKLRRDGCAWRSHTHPFTFTPYGYRCRVIGFFCLYISPSRALVFDFASSPHGTEQETLNFRCAQPICAFSHNRMWSSRLRVGSLECNTMCKYYEIFTYSASRFISSLHAHCTTITNELSDIVVNTQCLSHSPSSPASSALCNFTEK